jgi:nucleoside-diphosphate-sugar epimerase
LPETKQKVKLTFNVCYTRLPFAFRIYINDIARGTILAEKPLGYEIINLGGGKEPVSINQFIKWIEQLTGKKARINHQPVHSADMASTRANIQKAQTLLGWQPQTSTYQGLKNIVSQPQLLRFNC